MAFVQEKKQTTSSRRHGSVRSASRQPPQRSTTVRPPTEAHTAAPTSPRAANDAAKASRTGA
jgi:hypothetical protein